MAVSLAPVLGSKSIGWVSLQLAGRCTRVLSASALLSSSLATSVAGDVLHPGC